MSNLEVEIFENKKAANDTEHREMILKDVYVPNGTGVELAQRYPIPKWKSNLQDMASSDNCENITPSVASDIVFLTLSRILYGAYGFVTDSGFVNDFRVDSLSDIVNKVNEIDNKSSVTKREWHELYVLLLALQRHDLACFDTVNNLYPRHWSKERPGVSYFFDDLARMFCKNIGHYNTDVDCNFTFVGSKPWISADKYSMKCIYDINRTGDKVNQICDFIRTVKKMGDKYVCAETTNLYADAVLAGIEKSYAEHQEVRLVRHPRGKKR